jgi:hypothetical protein
VLSRDSMFGLDSTTARLTFLTPSDSDSRSELTVAGEQANSNDCRCHPRLGGVFYSSASTNSSTVSPAERMRLRSVPTAISL